MKIHTKLQKQRKESFKRYSELMDKNLMTDEINVCWIGYEKSVNETIYHGESKKMDEGGVTDLYNKTTELNNKFNELVDPLLLVKEEVFDVNDYLSDGNELMRDDFVRLRINKIEKTRLLKIERLTARKRSDIIREAMFRFIREEYPQFL